MFAYARHDDRLALALGRLALLVSSAVIVLIPVIYWTLSSQALGDRLEIMAEVKAQALGQVAAANPTLWIFQEHRLEELLVRNPMPIRHEAVSVRNEAGKLIVSVGDLPAPPLLSRSYRLHEYGRPIGVVVVQESLRDVMFGTAAAALLSLLIGAGIFFAMRGLPFRALRVAAALHDEKERAETTLKSIGDAVITTDAAMRVEYLNPTAEKLLGFGTAEAAGRRISEILNLVDEDSKAPLENPLRHALEIGEAVNPADRSVLARADGSVVAVESSAAPIRGASGAFIGGVMVLRDVSIARHYAQRITWQASHDPLTGLVNRREFENRVDAALVSARNSNGHHVVCYIDLDQFKVVNDTCGHSAGDKLLKDIAELLLSKIRAADTLARIGGDEFGLLLDGCPLDRAELIAADLIAAAREFRFSWQGKVFTLGISIGIAGLTANTASAGEALVAADTACYLAKEQGRNRACVYATSDSDMAERVNQMSWISRIHLAIEENRFTLYHQRYQCLDPASGEVNHIEVLLRMIDERGELVLPASFLPAAERYNAMPAIDRWVIKTVFANYARLSTSLGGLPLICAINLSGTSLNSEGLLEFIRAQAGEHAVPPGSICFEITETVAINNLRKAVQFMTEVRALGFLFALDDFGSGTSSFGYLKNLPVDYLKIDGTFVRDMERDPVDEAMTETINRIGHIMGVKTIAECAESEAIVDALRKLRVDFAQGHAVHPPAPLLGPLPKSNPV